MKTELLPEAHQWWRIADVNWDDPTDTSYSSARGGRWNEPGGHPTLYLNEDMVTARLNMRLFTEQWPYEPEDLRPDRAPVLVGITLPRSQTVVDAHTPSGVRALGLPATYPLDASGDLVTHDRCQPIGTAAKQAGLRGVRSRSATSPLGEGRELAWFPATSRSRGVVRSRLSFVDWYWA